MLRILEKDKTHINLNDLGFSTDTLEVLKKDYLKQKGLFLLPGQQDQEKNILYAGLKEISDRSQNILTIEDPVEYARWNRTNIS